MDERILQRLRSQKKVLATLALTFLVVAIGCTFVSLWYAPFRPFLFPLWAAMLFFFLGARRLQKLEKQAQK